MAKKTSTDFLFGVETEQHTLLCGLRALGFVQDAMERGERSPDEYADAVYGLWRTLKESNDALGELVEAEFRRGKGKKKGG